MKVAEPSKLEVVSFPLHPTPLPQESLNRVDTQLCFVCVRGEESLKAKLLALRQGMAAQCAEAEEDIPDRLLPTAALQRKKHALELRMAKPRLHPRAPLPPLVQVERREALERVLSRRIPGRKAARTQRAAGLRALSHGEFLASYRTCAQQLYAHTLRADGPYAALFSEWEAWQAHTQESENRFGDAWLWQHI